MKYNQKIDDSELNNLVYDVYTKLYYTPMKINMINDLMISAHLFCHGVNAGNSAAIKLLQKSINSVYNVSIAVDGKIGAQTLKYANGDKVKELINEFINRRISFYESIVNNNPSQKKFLKGWINRVNGTTETVKKYSNQTSSLAENVLYADVSINNKENILITLLKLIIKIFSFKK